MRFVIYYLLSPPAVSCPPFLSFSLIDTILHFVWDLYSFFFLYHCYYPRTMLPKAMLIRSRSGSLLQSRIHLVLPPARGNKRDNRPGIEGCPCQMAQM